MYRAALACVGLMLSANALNAQITTYMAQPRPLAPSPLAVATADAGRRDSMAQASMTNMKAWVDSAAGVSVPAHVGGIDSSALQNDPGRPVVTTFSNGTVAPATASDLPAIAIVGALVLIVGAGLVAHRPR